jgi:hypothetical protein
MAGTVVTLRFRFGILLKKIHDSVCASEGRMRPKRETTKSDDLFQIMLSWIRRRSARRPKQMRRRRWF